MVIQHDRKIIISAAGSRKATQWPGQTLYWSEMVERLKTPARGTETFSEYMKLSKAEQADLKDVGGYIGGELKNNRRKASNVLSRDLITLDLDNISAGQTKEIVKRIGALGCSYVIYSTRKHEETKPRLRVVVPTNRSITADEYEPVARKLASIIGMSLADPTTFEASRLMYWNSCCSDAQTVFEYGDKPFLEADGILATYTNWQDITEWPEVPGASQSHVRMAAKQENPTTKPGLIGSFCRQYDIYSAIETFLSGIYTEVDDGSGRYTFVGGSTVGGAVIYDEGLFLYSHHATDPCGGKLVNAFDLVRLHKYGDQDDDSKPETPVNKMPSFVSMAKFAAQDPEIKKQQIQEDFGTAERFEGENLKWLEELEEKPNGKGYKNTSKNIKLILKNDPALAGKFVSDIFGYRELLIDSVPWRKITKPRVLNGKDDSGLRNFLSDQYQITGLTAISDALNEILLDNEFHPVREYLKGLTWDGVKRVETFLVDYLGAEDNELNRAMTRLTLTGAVARVFKPGCKFDYVLTLVSRQGTGKSSLLDKLCGDWFTDSLEDVRGKDAYEQIQGSWIVELAELSALRKADVERVKQFTAARSDKFRQAYSKRSEEYPRQCIFIASTNDDEPLKDQTGGRRFWPVAVGVHPFDIEETRRNFPRDQIWAEAVEIFKKGDPLMLPADLEKKANELQQSFTEESPHAGYIRENLDLPWGSDFLAEEEKIKDRVCAMEIWCEMLGFTKDKFTTAKAREINGIMKNSPGWRIYPKNNGRVRHGKYGKQTVFDRVPDSD